MARRIVPVILILSLVGFFGYRIWHQKQLAALDDSFYGTVEAVEVTLSAQVAGRIVELNAEEGARVSEGDLLVRVDDAVYQAQRDQAQAAVSTALSQHAVINASRDGLETNLDRTKKLLSGGSATQMQLDNLEAQDDVLQAQKRVVNSQAAQARAMVRMAEEQLSFARIVAPIDGTVVRLHVEPGETVFPGSTLMTLADLSTMEVKIYVPEPMLGKIKMGQQVTLTTDSFPNKPLTGVVSTIAETAEFTPKNVQTRDERVRLVYAVKVRAANPDGILKIGMPVDARFVTE